MLYPSARKEELFVNRVVKNKPLRVFISGFIFLSLFLQTFLFVGPQHRTAKAASYSPYDIEKTVYDQRWDTEGSNRYSPTSGKQIQYDVYKGSGISNKQGYKIEQKNFGKGTEPFLTFTGWSALIGYTHHSSSNQSTYIIAVNKKEQKEKMYRLQQTSLDASKDIEYNRKSSSGPITNRCPNGTYNKMNNTCNMDYKSVGFKAWIPLKDLFPDENKSGEWELYIVKRVGTGSRLNVVYDKLITPFEFAGKTFQKGSISLSSGENAKQLEMLVSDAVRRSGPRTTDNGGNYFTKGKTYSAKTHSEKYTAVWYGVSSPHDGGDTRWAASLYWRSQGDPATIRYDVGGKTCPDGSKVAKSEPCTVDVTIRHVDIDTGQLLRLDQKKSTVGDDYSYKPAKPGTFTKDGMPYIATPLGQKFEGTTGNDNMSFIFTYRAEDNPNVVITGNKKSVYFLDGEEPVIDGYFFWELRRTKSDSLSEVYVESKFTSKSNHRAVKDIKLVVLGPNISKQHESAISFSTNANELKNKNLTYNFSYQYTNYYKKVYYWVPATETKPGYWKYSKTETAWDKGKIFSLENEADEDLISKVNHSQKESFNVNEMKEISDISLVVGKRDNWENNKRVLHRTYYEKFSKPSYSQATSDNLLHAQTFLKMEPDRVFYEVGLPSDEQKNTSTFAPFLKQGSSGYYFPVDIDQSLQEHYKVVDENNEGNVSIPEPEKLPPQGDTKFVTGQTSENYDQDGYKGTLTPYISDVTTSAPETKYVTNQDTSSYNDQDGFYGMLDPYVSSGSYTSPQTKWVEGEVSSDYNSGGYTGTLSPYVSSGSYTPPDSKTVTDSKTSSVNSFSDYLYYSSGGYEGYLTKSGTASEVQTGGSTVPADTYFKQYSFKMIVNRSDIPQTYYYSSGGYSGLLDLYKDATTGGYGAGDQQDVPERTLYYSGYVTRPAYDSRTYQYTQNYSGTVTKPAEDTRVWRYQGYVTKPAVDTRVWRYQGYVMKDGIQTGDIRYKGYVTKAAETETTSDNEYHDNPYNLGNYAFPLQMSRLTPIGANENGNTYEINFVSDQFFMSKDYGYVGYYPYAERVKENLVSGKALPKSKEILEDVTARTSDLFKKQTGETFEDTFLYTDPENLQRYYIPADAASPLENKTDYKNEIVLNDMGLSDVTFTFAQTFSFDLYLIGSVYDEVSVWEQVEPRVQDVEYEYSVVLTPEQQKEIMAIDRNNYVLHGFRLVDVKRIYDDVKHILKVSFGDFW